MDARTDNVKTVYPTTNKFAGGIISNGKYVCNQRKSNLQCAQTVPQNIYHHKFFSSFWSPDFEVKSKWALNSVQKFCCNGFSKFLCLNVILGPTSLWESYWCRPPLMSPAGHLHVRAPGKDPISWGKSCNWETHPQTKTIWHSWNALHEQIWKHQQFYYNIWEWSFQWLKSSWEIIKCDYTPVT